MTRRTEPYDPFVAGLGAASALIVLAAALVPLRSWLGNTNVALVLVVGIVAAAAIGGRAAGVAGSVAAALAYDFFHTVPHYEMHIEGRVDRITTALLLAVGILTGEIVVRVQRARAVAGDRELELVRLRRAAHLAATTDAAQLIPMLEEEISDALGLWYCRFEAGPLGAPMPHLTRQGVRLPAEAPVVTADPNTWAVDLPVLAGEVELGHFVLIPHEASDSAAFPPDGRRDALAMADQLAAVLITDPDQGGPDHG